MASSSNPAATAAAATATAATAAAASAKSPTFYSPASTKKRSFILALVIIAALGAVGGLVYGVYTLVVSGDDPKTKDKECNPQRYCKTTKKCVPGCSPPLKYDAATCKCECDLTEGEMCTVASTGDKKCFSKCKEHETRNENCECICTGAGYYDKDGDCIKRKDCGTSSVDPTTGKITGTWWQESSNDCLPGCNSAGVGAAGEKKVCDALCVKGGFEKFRTLSGGCVKDLHDDGCIKDLHDAR